ncbi:phosphatase PAP2 family protein [Nesterenkonia sp. F]|uniref:phosphatase PAP2 family protein n=1 Tax=Nesterenkonia sp. F TaxID=795955 RepID=UPI000255CFD1|nr:phosphatase PAP2 family protein [Nesterenkonia sp. F]
MQTDSRTTLRRFAALGLGAGLLVPSLAGCAPGATADGAGDDQSTAEPPDAAESPEASARSESPDAAEVSYASDETTSTGSQEDPDPDNWSIRMLDVFDTLRTDGEHAGSGNEEVMTYNDDITVEINTTASAEEHERAITDQYGDMSLTMADGLGEELGAIYEQAMEAGELPLTQKLLSKDGGMIGAQASTNPPKTYFDVDRPYLQMNMVDGELVHSTEEGGRLTLVDEEGGDAWDSTSGAFPSGHTSQAYWQGTALATMLPELAPQILARTAEAGDNRIVMGAHYALDVIGGRMMGQKIVQLRWADDEFAELMEDASEELRGVLEEECGTALETCVAQDEPYMSTDEALDYYEDKMSYDFPLAGETGEEVVVPEGAESLLATSRPDLTDEQRREVLALTATESGHPLDAGEEESWQRLNLAAAMSAEITVGEDGAVSLVENGPDD